MHKIPFMHAAHRRRELYLLAALVMVASCDLEGEPTASVTASKSLAVQSRASDEAELRAIYREVSETLAARGVTPAEAEAVGRTGDAEAARALLGWDQRRFDEVADRYMEIGERIERGSRGGGGGGGDPSPGDDRPPDQVRLFGCRGSGSCVIMGILAGFRYGKAGLLIFPVVSGICLVERCTDWLNFADAGWPQMP